MQFKILTHDYDSQLTTDCRLAGSLPLTSSSCRQAPWDSRAAIF
jgi:hypothetical protein